MKLEKALDGWNRGDQPNEMGANLPAAISSGAVAATGRGNSRSHAVLENGTMLGWGTLYLNNLALSRWLGKMLGVELVGSAWNCNSTNQWAPPATPVNLGERRTAVSIHTGVVHTCAALDNGQVKCWGANTNAQLGLGDTNNRGDGPNEMGDNLPTAKLFSNVW